MPIDLIREQPITIAVARTQHLPRLGGRTISPTTAYRWISKGVLAGDGTRVRLSAVKLGRSLMTTREAVERFLGELTLRSSSTPSLDEASQVETRAKLLAQGLFAEEPEG